MCVEDLLIYEEKKEKDEDLVLRIEKNRGELEALRQPRSARDNALLRLGEAKRNTVAQLF